MRSKIAAVTESRKKMKGTIETNIYVIKYSGVNRSTRTRAVVIIWIHKSIKNTVINYTYWSERITEVKLDIGRGKLSFFFTLRPRRRESWRK